MGEGVLRGQSQTHGAILQQLTKAHRMIGRIFGEICCERVLIDRVISVGDGGYYGHGDF